jgi:hypothetical protein
MASFQAQLSLDTFGRYFSGKEQAFAPSAVLEPFLPFNFEAGILSVIVIFQRFDSSFSSYSECFSSRF